MYVFQFLLKYCGCSQFNAQGPAFPYLIFTISFIYQESRKHFLII